MALAVGVPAAVAAAALYNAGLLLQADASRREDVGARFSPTLLGRLAMRRRWLAGSVVAILGWPLHAFALTRAPLTVVQPMLAIGLLVPLVFGARMLGESVRRRDVFEVFAIAVGVSLLVAAAPPRTADTAVHLRLGLALAGLAGLVLASLLLISAVPRWRGSLLILGAGVGFALTALTTKLLADASSRHEWTTAGAWLGATIAAGGVALAGEMSALQIRAASVVASLVFALETVIPVALSPVLFGERGNASDATLTLRVVALALILGAAFGLNRSPLVVHALAEDDAQSSSFCSREMRSAL